MQTIYAKPNVESSPDAVHLRSNTLVAPNGNGNGTGNRALVDALVGSRVYRDYGRAFSDMTGLPVALQPVETWQLPHHGKRNENPFCALMSQKSRACAACLQVQERLCNRATTEPQTVACPAGLSDTAVPVRLSDRLIGYLQTGQVFRKRPTEVQFERTAKQVEKWGLDVDRDTLRNAYFAGKVVSPKQHESAIKLLTIFARPTPGPPARRSAPWFRHRRPPTIPRRPRRPPRLPRARTRFRALRPTLRRTPRSGPTRRDV